MIRYACIFCEKKDFKLIYTQSNAPLAFCGTDIPNNYNYNYKDLNWIGCKNCYTIQLQNLIDPNILYGISHNNTYDTPTWIQHHLLFLEFIKKNCKYKSILEIGGGNNYLASKLYNNFLEYSILDLFDPTNKLKSVKYIIENCESFNYDNYSTVILSHVFEHLYNPLEFIKRVSQSKVKEIFISVPNLKYSFDSNSISFIHNEHTFYFEETDIVNIFNNYKYILQDKIYFNNHSLFFYFVFDDSYVYIEPYKVVDIKFEQFKNYFTNRAKTISDIQLNNPTFIIPSGHYGSLIYNYLKDKTKILGFLDNDISKQYKYLYGTNILTYPMNYISNYDNIDIILHAGPYSSELTKQLMGYNKNINLITF
jgi:hypothetical protein